MFFTRLWKALSLGLRMLKNMLFRPFRAIYFQIQRSASLSRQAARMAPKLAKSITKVKLKPESRADYIETNGAYIAKPLFAMLIIVLLALGTFGYFVAWPWLESRFFVAHIPVMAEKAATHSGRVALYYDNDKTQLQYEGRLVEGVRQGAGKEYYEDGTLKYDGDIKDGLYNGQGVLYDETGAPMYEGNFVDGIYEGSGTLYENGVRIYAGGFSQGLYEGQGTLYENGDLPAYEGGFVQGQKSGNAKVYEKGDLLYQGGYDQDAYNGNGKLFYPKGSLQAEGTFSAGRMTGRGIEYYENGQIRYQGMFDLGAYEGDGVLYHENGKMLYRGGFSLGQYEGDGTLYHENGEQAYKGGFSLGQYEGEGTIYWEDGSKHIIGIFEGGEPVGDVEIYDKKGNFVYKGGYQNGKYQGNGTLYYSPMRRVEGTFAEGLLHGDARLYLNDKLYYEGGFQNGLYHGQGTLYNDLGEAIFTGPFRNGLPDGTSFLRQAPDAVYAAFGEGKYIETYTTTGILIISQEAYMAAFLNYPTEAIPSEVHRFYCYHAGLLEGYTLSTLPLPASDASLRTGRGALPVYDDIPFMEGTDAYEGRLSRADYYFAAWAQRQDGPVEVVEYKSTVPLPIPETIPPLGNQAVADPPLAENQAQGAGQEQAAATQAAAALS